MTWVRIDLVDFTDLVDLVCHHQKVHYTLYITVQCIVEYKYITVLPEICFTKTQSRHEEYLPVYQLMGASLVITN